MSVSAIERCFAKVNDGHAGRNSVRSINRQPGVQTWSDRTEAIVGKLSAHSREEGDSARALAASLPLQTGKKIDGGQLPSAVAKFLFATRLLLIDRRRLRDDTLPVNCGGEDASKREASSLEQRGRAVQFFDWGATSRRGDGQHAAASLSFTVYVVDSEFRETIETQEKEKDALDHSMSRAWAMVENRGRPDQLDTHEIVRLRFRIDGYLPTG